MQKIPISGPGGLEPSPLLRWGKVIQFQKGIENQKEKEKEEGVETCFYAKKRSKVICETNKG